jgi:hypothetical protein
MSHIFYGWINEFVNWNEDKKFYLTLSPESAELFKKIKELYSACFVPFHLSDENIVIPVGSSLAVVKKMNYNILEYIQQKNTICGVELAIKIKPQKYNIGIRGPALKFLIESIDLR